MRRQHRERLVAALLAVAFAPSADAYDISGRWTTTQTDGGGLRWGDATTVTWSVVPDGEGYSRADESNLIDYLDDAWDVGPASRGADLTNRPWWSWMDRAYAQYSRTSGLTLVYVPEQLRDGADAGAEGDLRIGGEPFTWDADGTGGLLADNSFPNNGDMRIDTNRTGGGDASWWHSNAAPFRNMIAHESGHGMGLAHSEITSGAKALMQSILRTDIWGLQFDDVYALNRLYGDPLEKNGGNDSRATATPLGDLGLAGSVTRGRHASDTVVDELDDDWVGVDGASDTDWFRFDVSGRVRAGIAVTPLGPTYVTQEQGQIVAAAQSDLTARVYALGQTTPLATLRMAGAGEAESVSDFTLPDAGDYYVRIDALQDANQFYRLDLSVADATPDPVEPYVVFRDRFGGGEINADRHSATRQAGGLVDSPYSVRHSGGAASEAQIVSGSLALANAAGAGDAFTQVDVLRNFSPQLKGERWAASFALDMQGELTTDESWFAFLFDDGFEPGWPQTGDSELSFQLTGDGAFTVTERRGDAGEAHAEGQLEDRTHQFRLLVDETGEEPLVDVWVDGLTVIDGEPVLLNSDGRYFSFRLWSAAGEAAGATLDALVDDLVVSLVPEMIVPGDFDRNGVVDHGDYLYWRGAFGTADLLADGNDDGRIDATDYALWRDNLGASAPLAAAHAPEPTAGALLLSALLGALPVRHRCLRG